MGSDTIIETARWAADVINPVFVGLLVAAPLARAGDGKEKRSGRDITRFWAQSVVGVGAAVALAEMGKKLGIWPGHHNFPSGHTTFAAASAMCLYYRGGPRTLWITAPLTGAMMGSLVIAGWHTPDETLGALVLGPLVVRAVWWLTRSRPPSVSLP